MNIKSIREARKLAGKKVFLRADFNVPIIKGEIKNDYKIISSLPTIRFLLRHKCKIIIATHLGRPNGRENDYSVKPIALKLSRVLGRKVKFVDDCIGLNVGTKVSEMENGDIILLENLRFHDSETKNNKKFAKKLSFSIDLYVNDAFGVSHRKQASVCAITKFLPAYAGLLLEKELLNLKKISRPKKPMVAIIGGSKIVTKLPLIKKIRGTVNQLLVGGALANNFLAAMNYEVGKSLVDKKSIAQAKKIHAMYRRFGANKLVLPVDVVVGGSNYGASNIMLKNIDEVDKDDFIFDIGPKTIKLFSEIIKKANTIIWNGPLGKYESEHFRHGTMSLARTIASRSTGRAFGVVGGGETIEALSKTKMLDYVDWASTGGGAMLSYLGGEKMPGLKGIVKK